MNIDQSIYRLINQKLTSDTLDVIMFDVSDKYFWIPFYIAMILALIWIFKRKSSIIILMLFVSVLLSDRTTSGLMKPTFKRERPCHVAELTPRIIPGVHCSDTGSMASSHAANHFAVAIFMILLTVKRYKRVALTFWLLWAALVAYSRVYLGVHYPSDVLVGGICGAIFGWLCFIGYDKIIRKIGWHN